MEDGGLQDRGNRIMEKIFGIATQGLAKVSNFLKMTNDKFPTGVIRRSGLFVICHFESGASLEALEFRALSGSGPKYLCNEIAVALARHPPSILHLRYLDSGTLSELVLAISKSLASSSVYMAFCRSIADFL